MEVPDDLPAVTADNHRIEEVLAGLVENALQYAGGGRDVIVSADQVGRFVQCSVADDGAGNPVDQQSRIFEKFERLGRPGEPEGSGLGLAVAHAVVRTHRVAIWVDSGPGPRPGSIFNFTIPTAENAHRGTEQGQAASVTAGPTSGHGGPIHASAPGRPSHDGSRSSRHS